MRYIKYKLFQITDSTEIGRKFANGYVFLTDFELLSFEYIGIPAVGPTSHRMKRTESNIKELFDILSYSGIEPVTF